MDISMHQLLKMIVTVDSKRELFTWFIHHPNEKVYLRQISRIIGMQVNALSRELSNLTAIGFVKTYTKDRKKYFTLNKEFLLLPELQGLILKTTGLGSQVIEKADMLGQIEIAILTHNYINNIHMQQYDIDLLIVGSVNIPVVSHMVKEIEVSMNREIKYTVISMDEFLFRRKKRDIFIENILNKHYIVLIGTQKLHN